MHGPQVLTNMFLYIHTHVLTLSLECKVTYSGLVLTGQMPSAAFVLGTGPQGSPTGV